jgi:hypothetical protein
MSVPKDELESKLKAGVGVETNKSIFRMTKNVRKRRTSSNNCLVLLSFYDFSFHAHFLFKFQAKIVDFPKHFEIEIEIVKYVEDQSV